ncbi:MAG: Chaperone protein YajL [Verrucomicrobiota bacterium]|jgi:4-methyl-5(b-hydroxyethyl)-thiazole monophosphate biosynthesis
MKKRVLCLLVDGFEEIETVTPVDLLRRAGVDVVMASLVEGIVTGRCGIRLQPDVVLDSVVTADFDLLFIPGGPGVEELRRDGRAAALAREFSTAGKTVAAICAAPLVLKDAGLLDGRKFTAHFSAHDDLPDITSGRVVMDGNLITSRGAGTALDFGLALVRHLAGDHAADEVARAIMA